MLVKNIRTLIACGLISLTILPLSARNFIARCGDYRLEFSVVDEDAKTCATFKFIEVSDEVVTALSSDPCILELPGQVTDGEEWYTVVSVGEKSFYGCEGIDVLILPETVTTIEHFAFQSSLISSFQLPDGVRSIGVDAFDGCKKLKDITLPSGIRTLPSGIFYGCRNLETINLEGIAEIGNFAFSGCEKLIHTGDLRSLTIIHTGAFAFCSSIQTLEIPNVTEIGWNAFRSCTALSALSIPSGVKAIEKECFTGCSSLVTLHIPDNVEEIGMAAFKGCSSLEEITMAPSVRVIGSNAFAECDALRRITVMGPEPPTAYLSSFPKEAYLSARLIVPSGSENNYQTYGIWQFFANLETGVSEVSENQALEEVARYTLDGVAVDASYKGLVIVRYADGSARKVVVK